MAWWIDDVGEWIREVEKVGGGESKIKKKLEGCTDWMEADVSNSRKIAEIKGCGKENSQFDLVCAPGEGC